MKSHWDEDYDDQIDEFASHVIDNADFEMVAKLIQGFAEVINGTVHRRNATVQIAIASLLAEFIKQTPDVIPREVVFKTTMLLVWNYAQQTEDDEP